MNQRDIVKLLESLFFDNLTLVKSVGETSTFSYSSYDQAKLVKALGKPTVAAGNKVAVFEIPGTGKIGVSPTNSMVRIVPVASTALKPQVNDSHLRQKETTEELSLAYKRAQGNPRFRLTFTKDLWTHFNYTKFSARMKMPKIEVAAAPSFGFPRGLKSARGIHHGGNNYTPGIIFIADFLFNGREAFFYEILLHEMCHQAVWELDHYRSTSAADGHGKKWASWMTHVGLDPRRFDPTDGAEYQDTPTRAREEAELDVKYGIRKDPSYFQKLTPMDTPPKSITPCVFDFKGRALEGVLVPCKNRGFTFEWARPKASSLAWQFTSFPTNKIYVKS